MKGLAVFPAIVLTTIAAFLLFVSDMVFAHLGDKVVRISVETAVENQPFVIQAELSRGSSYEKIFLAYRSPGQGEFRRIEMTLTSATASVTIPAADVRPPLIEYYFIIQMSDDPEMHTHPAEDAAVNPLTVTVAGADERDREVIFLSPERGESVTEEEFVISFSLFRASPTVDKRATRVFLDEVDVTTGALFSDDLVVVRPRNVLPSLRRGAHIIRIALYRRDGSPYHTVRWPVRIVATAQEVVARPLPYRLALQAESRNETINDNFQSYNRANLTGSSTVGDFVFNGRLYVTNEERKHRQPQNRYNVGVESPWARVSFGDNFPTFPRLIMDGKRVRGVLGNVTLGFFNLDVTAGEIVRKIGGDTVRTFFEQDTASFSAAQHPIGLFDSTAGGRRWAEYRYGTFSRNLFAIRPSFGSGKSFQLGFSYLKSKDDVGSIRYGVRPQENIVAGSDLLLALDDRRIELTAQAAFSASNRDISSGTISDARLDSLFGTDSSRIDDIKKWRDVVSRFITVNEHLVPLSAENLTTLAYEGALALNYFNNHFKFTYMRRGNAFESFGQNFLRTDVQGFSLMDRLRLMQNRLIFSIRYEQLEDNIGKTKAATTTFSTFSGAVTYFPRSRFPNFTLGYAGTSNNNGIHSDSLFAVDDLSHRVFVQMGYDFRWGVRHSAQMAFSTNARDDRTIRGVDASNTSLSFAVNSIYNRPLQTTAGLSMNFNSFSRREVTVDSTITTDVNYVTLILKAQYRLMEEKLHLNGGLLPTFGDVQRTVLDAGAQYFFLQNLSTLFQLSFYLTKDYGNDVVWSLMLRYGV